MHTENFWHGGKRRQYLSLGEEKVQGYLQELQNEVRNRRSCKEFAKYRGVGKLVASALRGENKGTPGCTVGLTYGSNALCGTLVDETTTTVIKDYFLWHSKTYHIVQPLIDSKIKLILTNLDITKLSRGAFDSMCDSSKHNFKVNV